MIRIGFDPALEAEQRNRELYKQAEQYRMAKETQLGSQPKVSNGAKILAFIGREMASLGASLEARYSTNIDTQINVDTQGNSSGCIS